jgi:hypothetical protein
MSTTKYTVEGGSKQGGKQNKKEYVRRGGTMSHKPLSDTNGLHVKGDAVVREEEGGNVRGEA